MISSGIASSSTTASPRTRILDASYDISYDVFLSFRGDDTRRSFADHLYNALMKKEIHTFRDKEEVRKGESIAPTLSKAIKGSTVFIVIFSKNYADSRWCLIELEEIMECSRKTGRKVYPIFYHVDPSHVRYQKEDYGRPFSKYEENADEEKMLKIGRWRDALGKAGNLNGFHVTTEYETKVIEEVIEDISIGIVYKPFIMDKLIVNESILNDLIEFITIQPEDVRMIGIHGVDGIGKTTIAQAICKKISSEFEGVSFLANVRKVSKEYLGLQRLQGQLIRDILVTRGNREIIFYKGNNVIKQICCRKVLIFLDDVDDLEQLRFLAGESNWFGEGSRIIITCTAKEILTSHNVESHELRELENREDQRDLFIQHAISKGQTQTNSRIRKLLDRAIDYCCGLPLALKVVGSFLKMTEQKWEDALVWLERHDDGEFNKKNLKHVLSKSFEELRHNDKDVFFDVACFFNGEHKNFVTKILDGRFFSPEDGIKVLSNRHLLITTSDQKLWMHNSIQEVGREMVCQETKKRGEISRLWYHDDVRYVLNHDKGTDKIEGIFLDLSELNQLLPLSTKAFAKMTELRVLKVFLGCKNVCEENCKGHFSGDLELSASDLRYLHWHRYPSDSVPSNFLKADALIEVHMPYSCLKHLKKDEGCFPQLTVLDLSYSRDLVEISNFSTMPKLEKLILEGCTSLREIDSSIGHLDKLIFLNLNGCKNIVSQCLEILTAEMQISEKPTANRPATSGSTSQVPLFGLCSLRELDLSECLLSDGVIPNDFWCLSSLERLNLSGNDFTVIPDGNTHLPKLRVLQLGYCKRLLRIPNLPPTVEEVDAHDCSSLEPSSNIRDATTILRKIQNLAPTTEFCILLPGSEIPHWFEHRNMGHSVTIVETRPAEWHQVNLLGVALCFVFASDHEKPEHTPVVSCKINDFRFSYTFSCGRRENGRGENGFVESDHVWLAYQPRAEVKKSHPYNYTQIEASFEVFGIGPHTKKRVEKCAIKLLYANDN